MRFLGITKNPDSGNTALSQPWRHSGGAKLLERQYFRSKTNLLFCIKILGMYFLPLSLRKSFLDLRCWNSTLPKKN